MFPPSYFPPAYYAARYFPEAGAGSPTPAGAGGYFPPTFFPPGYFPPRYFPSAAGAGGGTGIGPTGLIPGGSLNAIDVANIVAALRQTIIEPGPGLTLVGALQLAASLAAGVLGGAGAPGGGTLHLMAAGDPATERITTVTDGRGNRTASAIHPSA